MPVDRQSLAYKKETLSSTLSSVESSFNMFKNNPNCSYMGVYFTIFNKPYITFSNANDLPQTIRMSKNTNYLSFTYDTSLNFSTQTTAFLQ